MRTKSPEPRRVRRRHLHTKKPDAAPLAQAMRLLGTDPASCVVIGDSEVDAACADACGVPYLIYAGGYGYSAVRPERVFNSYRQLQVPLPALRGFACATA